MTVSPWGAFVARPRPRRADSTASRGGRNPRATIGGGRSDHPVMTERKPPERNWKSWVEEQIQDAQREGEFDRLEGKGKPIPGIEAP